MDVDCDDAFVGKHHAVAHGFIRVDDVFAVDQKVGNAFGVFVVLLEFEESFVVEINHQSFPAFQMSVVNMMS